MPSEQDAAPPNPFVALTVQWLETWHRAMVEAPDPRRFRSQWLGEVSRNVDLYLRSQDFLELMHASLGVMVRAGRLFSPPRPR